MIVTPTAVEVVPRGLKNTTQHIDTGYCYVQYTYSCRGGSTWTEKHSTTLTQGAAMFSTPTAVEVVPHGLKNTTKHSDTGCCYVQYTYSCSGGSTWTEKHNTTQ